MHVFAKDLVVDLVGILGAHRGRHHRRARPAGQLTYLTHRQPFRKALSPAKSVGVLGTTSTGAFQVERPDLLTIVTEIPVMHDSSSRRKKQCRENVFKKVADATAPNWDCSTLNEPVASLNYGVDSATDRSFDGNPSNPYWYLQIDPLPGVSVDMASITLTAGISTTLATPQSYRWDYDIYVNGYSSPIARVEGPTSTRGGAPNDRETAILTGITIDLSHLPTYSNTITIRIYPDRNGVNDGMSTTRVGWLDDVMLTGSIIGVPEPMSIVPLVLASVAVSCIRRRR